MFIIMILTVMILPPVSLFVASVYLEPPFGGDGHGRPPPGIGGRGPHFSFVRQLPLILSIVWLGVGVYPLHVLSKGAKKNEMEKKKKKRAEEKLGRAQKEISEQGH